jgi:sulfate transport system permease protein
LSILTRPSGRSKRVLPGFGLSLGISVLYISLIVALPASSLALEFFQLSLDQLWFYLTDPRLLSSFRVTLITSSISAILNCIIGLLLAWILVRYEFPGRRLMDTLIDLPFALPTAVAGLTLSALFATNGWVGRWLAMFDIKVSYTLTGIVLAMVFTSLPFVVRTLQPVLEDISSDVEEAARTLGATDRQIFWRVILPQLRPALTIGTALSFVRSLGEFGAVIFISGNMPFETEVTSLMVFTYVGEYNYSVAAAVAMVILLSSLLLLLFIQFIQYRHLKPVRS